MASDTRAREYRPSIFVLSMIAVLCGADRISAQTTAGAGSYATDGAFAVPTAKPWVTDDFAQKHKSAQWWSTLITQQFSDNLFAHPGSFKATAKGLEMGYPGSPTFADKGGFSSSHIADLTIGIEGMTAEAARVASYSHWSVTARWKDAPGTKVMEATIGHGLPFAYFKITGGKAVITSSAKIWYDKDGTLGITQAGRSYGIFAPTGSSWSGIGSVSSTLNGKDYLSVALLPDGTPETLAFYRKYAFSFIKKTRVDWIYREEDARLVSTWSAETEAKEGTETGTLFALFRHQWLEASSPLTPYVYKSVRGDMKVAAGPSFQTVMKFNGILPAMPQVGIDAAALKTLVSGFTGDVGGGDSYGTGKQMGRLAAMAPIANLAGDIAKRDDLVKKLETGLESWLTAGGQQQLFYNKTWSALVGYPASYNSDTRLSDHHFHFGYFLMGAAVVAQFDPAWAQKEKWGGMVEMLIREVNSWDENDPLFGRFRYFDAYEGHGWADGMGFDRGNNQESSSESMNCNAGIIQWGIHTGNKAIRDLGIFMYVNETRAIEQYWFDVDDAVFPAAFTHNAVGMVWSNGGAYGTWFSGDPGAIHGINILPMAAGSLYLGRRPDHILKNYAEGNQGTWTDLFLQYLAFADGDQAATKYGAGVGAEGGDSKAHATYQIKSLQASGKLNAEIGASVPSFAVFDKGAVRTYTAYNATAAAATVTFTDGFQLDVPAHGQVTKQGPVKAIGILSQARSGRKSRISIWNGVAYPASYLGLPAGSGIYDLGGRVLSGPEARGDHRSGAPVPAPSQGIFITLPSRP
ncbi:MAG: Endo,3(4)-beta-glucanase [Fibrobacteres bacterium]|nr:Endo,3(4)-beta-glucanase [Fibrobacterota bacterium]